MASSRVLIAALAAVWAGCECGASVRGAACQDDEDCGEGRVCADRRCIERDEVDGGGGGGGDGGGCSGQRLCRGGAACCAEGEECVADFACDAVCPNERCGDNRLTCCEPGQVCLDGVVCAADCEPGQALCGADLGTCCAAGDVCLDDACVTPGDPCGDDYDCLTDETYCEPTIGRCLPNPSPPLCEVRPEFDEIALEVEWHWEGIEIDERSYQNVAAAPAVGDVSGDGVPDVVVAAYAGSNLDDAVLVAIDGADGSLHWSVGPGADEPESLSAVALANLDPADDALEIVYEVDGGGARILDGDGVTELARLETGSGGTTRVIAASIADMDHDDTLEIAVGCHVVSLVAEGEAWVLEDRFDEGPCTEPSQTFAGTAVANLDDDPEMEVTTGAAAFDLDGTRLWPAGGQATPHGIPAVADLDADGAPEVIQTRGGAVTIVDGRTGAVRVGSGGTWSSEIASIPGGGNGGAPTVADFDGDGLPEIAAAGQGCYAVYDPDCLPDPPRLGGDCTRPPDDPESTCDDSPGALLRWARPTQDLSSSATGSSVFDFQGDGVAEVVYNDECFLHVYDGRDGREVLAEPRPSSSRTALEYPVVVDVDRDGNSEIVVPSNDDQAVGRDECDEAYSLAFGVPIADLPEEFQAGTHGVYSFGDPNDRWVRTRPIWNQFTYHVTNVDDRGAVPVEEADNWTTDGLNNYRQNVQGEGVFNAPNLTVSLDAVARCADATVQLSAVVRNDGSRGVDAGVEVEFVQLAPEPERNLGVVLTTLPLLPGASERITIAAAEQPYDEELRFEARVDGAASVVECDEDDNTATATELCPGLL